MRLIKNLPTRLSKNGKGESWAVFWCAFCLQEVERRISNGKSAKSCGCKTFKLISEAKKGKKCTEEHKQKVSLAKKGKKRTKEVKQKISKTRIEKGIAKGENNPNWQDGKSFEPYGIEFNKGFKQQIFERDNYTCQCPDCKHKSNILDAHHIDYDKKNNIPENVITLCRSCHMKTNGKNKREYFKEFYQNIMMGKIMECFL